MVIPHPPSNPEDFDAWASTLPIVPESVLGEQETEKGKGNG